MININAYGGNSIELAAYIAKKTGSFGCVVTSKQCTVHCKCFDHKDYRDWKLQGTCREICNIYGKGL